jgi:hypothetical protein
VGCGCNLPAVTAAGNTGCNAVFEGFSMVLYGLRASHFGWVAIAQFLERWVAKGDKSPILTPFVGCETCTSYLKACVVMCCANRKEEYHG